jgi:alpha-galactosidase
MTKPFRRIGHAVVALLAFTVTALWATSSPAHAAGNPYILRSYLNINRCIDDPNSSPAQGTQLVLYTCNGHLNQDWWFIPTTDYGVDDIWFENGSSNICMTVYGNRTASNTAVIQYQCNEGANEVWRRENSVLNDSAGRDFYRIHPLNALNQCLTLQNNSSANNTKLIIYTCNGGGNQLWNWV